MTTSTTKQAKLIKLYKIIIVTGIWLGLWFLISAVIDKEILFVSPYRVVLTFKELVTDLAFWRSAVMSIFRVSVGFIIGMLFGIICALLAHRFDFFRLFITPLFTVIRATPVASFIILALVWITNDSNVPIFICVLMVSPIAWGNVTTGLDRIDSGLLDMSRVFRFKTAKRIRFIYIPSVMPYIMSAATTGLGLAWKAGIAAEVLCTPAFSIGKYIYNSKIYLETPELFAWTTLVVLLSVALEKILVFVMKKTLKRYNVGGDAKGD